MYKCMFSVIIYACVLISLLCSGCSNNVNIQEVQLNEDVTAEMEAEEVVEIGVAMASSESAYLVELVEDLEVFAQEKKVEYEIVYAEWNAEIQQQQVRQFIKHGVDAIILCPTDAKSSLDTLKEAEAAGIPVVNLNMKVDAISSEYIETYVGASSVEEGILAAELVTELLGEKGGIVGIIEGEPGSEVATYRTEAFLEEIRKVSRIQVKGITCGSWNQADAYESAWDLATNIEGLSIIYAHDSNMALGAYGALEDLGLEERVQIVSIGENELYLEKLESGVIDGIVTQSAEYEAFTSVSAALSLVQGGSTRPWYKTPAEKLTQSTMEHYRELVY